MNEYLELEGKLIAVFGNASPTLHQILQKHLDEWREAALAQFWPQFRFMTDREGRILPVLYRLLEDYGLDAIDAE